MGIEYYCWHDRDIAPELNDLKASHAALDTVVAKLKDKQNETGVKLLWGTACLFSHPRYSQGAATSPDASVYAYAGAQVKKALEATKELDGLGYTFWGGREGYSTLLNTNMKREIDHLAAFFTWQWIMLRKSVLTDLSTSSPSHANLQLTNTTATRRPVSIFAGI